MCMSCNAPDQARQSWQRDSNDMRYKRLQHLLQKSNIYSKFLLTKMEQQQIEVCHGATVAKCAAVTCCSPALLLSTPRITLLSMLSGKSQEGEDCEKDQKGEKQ